MLKKVLDLIVNCNDKVQLRRYDMTIKEFAKLCGCNSQTLRYYDRIDLLKPVEVDQWSGYRFYEEEQALDFVKIKNLQLAGFTIDEIKELIGSSDEEIYRAFEVKLSEQEEKIRTIREIQKSYQNEMENMKERLKEIQGKVYEEMERYNPEEEFGLDTETYQEIIKEVTGTFEAMAAEGIFEDYDFLDLKEDYSATEEANTFFNNPEYELISEKHGWKFAKEFIYDCLDLDDGDYNYVFKVTDEKEQSPAFPNIVLALALREQEKNPEHKRNLGCTVTNSNDGENHFWLFRKK